MFSQWKPCWLSWNKRNVTMSQKYKEYVAIFTNGKIHSVRSKHRPPFLCRKFKWKGGKFWVAIVNNTIKDKICILFSFLFFFFSFLGVRTYVIHLLETYVTILCNWLILWQNALYLYFGRSRMCLILQETVFQDQVLKICKSVQDSSRRSTIY